MLSKLDFFSFYQEFFGGIANGFFYEVLNFPPFFHFRDANWSPEQKSTKDFVTLMKDNNFDSSEIHIAVDIFNYIESQGELGAKAKTLLDRYEDKLFLQKLFDNFNELKLVMKTGVCEVTYVHWKHIKPWVINTYHLKRLDRVGIEVKF